LAFASIELELASTDVPIAVCADLIGEAKRCSLLGAENETISDDTCGGFQQVKMLKARLLRLLVPRLPADSKSGPPNMRFHSKHLHLLLTGYHGMIVTSEK